MFLLHNLDGIGAVLAFAGLLTFGAGADESGGVWTRVGGLAITATGLAFMGLHAVVQRKVRFGVRFRSMHVGVGAQLFGGVYLVLSLAALAAAAREGLHPGTLATYPATREGLAVSLGFAGLAGVFWGAALLFGTSLGADATPAALTWLRRLFGLAVAAACLLVVLAAATEVVSPGTLTAWLPAGRP